MWLKRHSLDACCGPKIKAMDATEKNPKQPTRGVERLSELHELLHDAERQRTCLEEEGEDKTLLDEVIPKLREEIRALSKIR